MASGVTASVGGDDGGGDEHGSSGGRAGDGSSRSVLVPVGVGGGDDVVQVVDQPDGHARRPLWASRASSASSRAAVCCWVSASANQVLAEGASALDGWWIDGIANGAGLIGLATGQANRAWQGGNLTSYALSMSIALLSLVAGVTFSSIF